MWIALIVDQREAIQTQIFLKVGHSILDTFYLPHLLSSE